MGTLSRMALAMVALALSACSASGLPNPSATPAAANQAGQGNQARPAPTSAAPRPTLTLRPAVPLNPVQPPAPTLPPEPGERVFADSELVQVFSTSALGAAMQQVAQGYLTANPDAARVQLTFGTPSRLIDQIHAGYPADVLAWDDPTAGAAIQQANVLDGPPHVLARGRLVMVVPQGNPKQITTLKDLAAPGARWATGRTDTQLGAATARLLDNAGQRPEYGASFRATAERNIQLRADTADDVLERVSEGGAGAGIVHAADVPQDRRNLLQVIELPDDINAIDDYSIGLVTGGPNPPGGRTFLAYVSTPDAQAILKKYGMEQPAPTARAAP